VPHCRARSATNGAIPLRSRISDKDRIRINNDPLPLYLQAPSYIIGVILALYPMSEASSALRSAAFADRFSRKKTTHHRNDIDHNTHRGDRLYEKSVERLRSSRNDGSLSRNHRSNVPDTFGRPTKLTNRGKQMGGFDLANLGGYGLGFGVGGLLVNSSLIGCPTLSG